MTRSQVIRGPARITYDGVKFYSQGDITIEEVGEFFDIEVSGHPTVDQRSTNIMHRVTFTPHGRWSDKSKLFPYATALVGSSVFGADKTLTIHTLAGQKRVYKAAAITQMPSIILASDKTLFGQVQFTCLAAEASNPETANSLFTNTAEAYTGDADFDPAAIITQPYPVVWGADAPWSSFYTVGGVQIDFDLSIEPVSNDLKGIFDYTFANLTVQATMQPEGITPTQLADKLFHQGAGAARGSSLNARGEDLIISSTGVYVSLTKAAIVNAGEVYGSAARNVGEVTWRATRSWAAGAPLPLFTVLDEAPEEP